MGRNKFGPYRGSIRRLTEWVLRSALRECRAWSEAGLQLPFAVNVSVRDLADTAFPEMVGRLIQASGVEPRLLTLEVTESVVMTEPQTAGRRLAGFARWAQRSPSTISELNTPRCRTSSNSLRTS